MGRATDTEIFPPAQELLVTVTQLTGNFPRNRRMVGQQLFDDAHQILRCIFLANAAHPASAKVPWIERLRERLISVQVSLRLSKELKLISAGQLGTTVVIVQSVGEQATGWLNWARKST